MTISANVKCGSFIGVICFIILSYYFLQNEKVDEVNIQMISILPVNLPIINEHSTKTEDHYANSSNFVKSDNLAVYVPNNKQAVFKSRVHTNLI